MDMSSTLLERSEEELRLISFVTHPKRLEILKTLAGSTRPLYIAEIAEKINEKTARNTSFHLMGLAERGLVEGKFAEVTVPENPSLGRAAKFYSLTEKGHNLIRNFGSVEIEI